MQTKKIPLDITKATTSRLAEVDFDNLVFGKYYTDHMMVCDYENGKWNTPKIMPYGPLSVEPSCKAFHYGQAIFEGMKAFKDENGKVWLFRPEENFNRANISCKRMAMPEFPKEYFFEALETLLKLDEAWIKTGDGNSLYIRPFVIASENGVSASPSSTYKFIIICCPAKAYYSSPVKVTIAQKYSRSADGGVGYAKAAGNYGASFYPTNLAKEKGYQQVIWTDASTHQYLEEAGTMNVFFRINDTLITAPTSDRILDGITRKSLIKLAQDQGLQVEIRRITVSELVDAAKNGSLKEMFGAGTAATIAPIEGFEYNGDYYELPEVKDSYSQHLKKSLQDIQYNRAEDKFGWRHEVPLDK